MAPKSRDIFPDMLVKGVQKRYINEENLCFQRGYTTS